MLNQVALCCVRISLASVMELGSQTQVGATRGHCAGPRWAWVQDQLLVQGLLPPVCPRAQNDLPALFSCCGGSENMTTS